MKEKYTRKYYLKEDKDGNQTSFGAEGLEEFKNGRPRDHDINILKHIDFNNKSVLDLGFGRGEAMKYALDNGAKNVIGVDFSEDANEIAKKFLESYNLYADLYCMDVGLFLSNEMDVTDKFDIVIMFDFVEHVPRSELTNILNLLKKHLTDKSILVINTPIYKIDNDVIKDGLLPEARDTSDDYEETSGMHCNRYTKKSLYDYMMNNGFSGVSGHYFIYGYHDYNLYSSGLLNKSKIAMINAINDKYPIYESAIFNKEVFEYGISSNEIKIRENRLISKMFRFSKRIYMFILKKISEGSYNKKMEKDYNINWVKVTGGYLKGYEMLLGLNTSVGWHKEMIDGCYDQFIYDELDKITTLNGKTIWDVGAAIGYHTFTFAACVGDYGMVVAFEPNTFNTERLTQILNRNVELKPRVMLKECALGNMNGEEMFSFSSEIENGKSTGSHLVNTFLPEPESSYKTFHQKNVDVYKIDTLIENKVVPTPDIIKIDVEGAESFVLDGARKLLTVYKPILLIEIHNIKAMHETLNILFECGYKSRIIESAPYSLSRCFIIAEHIPEPNELKTSLSKLFKY